MKYFEPMDYDDGEEEFYEHPEGRFVLAVDAQDLLNKITKLEAQLKHNSDRDYNRGFEDGLRAGLNGG